MMLSNVAGFLCHIVNIIVFLYNLIFYPKSTSSVIVTATNLIWLTMNVKGLLVSGSSGIIVNHMVGYVVCYSAQTCAFCSICMHLSCVMYKC